MITKDPMEAFEAFLDGCIVEYHRPNIDIEIDSELDYSIQWHLIDKYSPLFVFKNEEARTDEECKLFRITG